VLKDDLTETEVNGLVYEDFKKTDNDKGAMSMFDKEIKTIDDRIRDEWPAYQKSQGCDDKTLEQVVKGE
jgi:hypothetical protein